MIIREELLNTEKGRAFASSDNYTILAIKDTFAIPKERVSYYEWCHISESDIIAEITKKNN
jgi:hypothetical protein